MKNYTVPQSLADMFDNTFKLVGKTFSRTLIVSAILIIPGSIMLVVGLDWFYSSVGDFITMEQNGEEVLMEQAFNFVAGMVLLLPGAIIFLIAYAGAKSACTSIVCSEITEKQITWNEALRNAFQVKVWKVIGQGFLEYLLYIGIMVLAGVVAAIVGAASLGFGVLMIIIMIFSVAGVILYCSIHWLFTLQAIVWEESSVIASFGRSRQLVVDYWWRTLGIIFLFALLVGFAQSLISTPLMFLAMWDFYSSYFQSIASSGNETMDPAMVGELMSSFGYTIGMYAVFSAIFAMILEPVYRSVMYFDLRARKGEFKEQESPRPFASYFGQPQ